MKNTGSCGKKEMKNAKRTKPNGNNTGKKVEIDQSSFSEYGYTLLLETVLSEVTGNKRTVKPKSKKQK